MYSTRIRENSWEKTERLSEKSIHDPWGSDNPSNHRKDTYKKFWVHEIKCLRKIYEKFVDFSKTFDSIHREKMKPKLFDNGIPKKLLPL